MKSILKRIFSSNFVRFVIVGVLNTAIGTAVMFLSYNFLHTGYWISSALNYIVGSIFSYFANKYFTFNCKKKSWKEAVRFVLNISICYFIAYGLAQPIVIRLFSFIKISFSGSLLDQIAMIVGMVIFVIINFIGQKVFVFKKQNRG